MNKKIGRFNTIPVVEGELHPTQMEYTEMQDIVRQQDSSLKILEDKIEVLKNNKK